MTSLLLFNTKQYNMLGFVLSGFTLNCLISITSKIPVKRQVKFRGRNSRRITWLEGGRGEAMLFLCFPKETS